MPASSLDPRDNLQLASVRSGDPGSRDEVVLLVWPASFLVFLEGLVVLWLTATHAQSVTLPWVASAYLPGVGVAGLVLGAALGAAAWEYSRDSLKHGQLGAVMILVGAVSLWVGGGFVVGAILAVAAGLVAILHPHSPP